MKTSFDMPHSVARFMEEAIAIQLIQVNDIWALSVNHGGDFKAIMAEIVGYAFVNRHFTDQHSIMCKLHDGAVMDLNAMPTN